MLDCTPPSEDLSKTSDGNGETVPAAGSPRLAGSVDFKSLASEAISECRIWIFNPKHPQRIQTVWHQLDAMTGGLRPGSLHVVASPPSTGKSTFQLNVLEAICLNQKTRSLFFCGDMAPLEVVQRFLIERGLLPRECLQAEDRQLIKLVQALHILKVGFSEWQSYDVEARIQAAQLVKACARQNAQRVRIQKLLIQFHESNLQNSLQDMTAFTI